MLKLKLEGAKKKKKRDENLKEDSREGDCENGRHMELAEDHTQLGLCY